MGAVMGRPTKRTPETEQRIIDAVRAGNYIEVAATYAGISKQTLYAWRESFPDFSDALEKALAEAEVRSLTAIQQAGRTHWQAHAWYLERRYPKRYGRRIEVSQAPPIDASLYTPEELEQLRALLLKGQGVIEAEPQPARLELVSGE